MVQFLFYLKKLEIMVNNELSTALLRAGTAPYGLTLF